MALNINKIVQGHVLEILKTLPNESVNCAVTSPPYWGLRDYGLEPQVWDDKSNCEHEWQEYKTKQMGGHNTPDNPPNTGSNQSEQTEGIAGFRFGTTSNFCVGCGAWRGSLGLEPTPELYVQHLVTVFQEIKRVLRRDGTAWLNLGDSYNGTGGGNYQSQFEGHKQGTNIGSIGTPIHDVQGLKPKDLCGIPWGVAFALQADGWWLRSDIIWSKPNPMPEPVTDRPTKAHEYVFLLTKSADYWYDADAVREPQATVADGRAFGKNGNADRNDQGRGYSEQNPLGRNKRSVWTINTQPYPEAHFATFPEALVEPMIKAGCPEWICGTCGKPRERITESKSLKRNELSRDDPNYRPSVYRVKYDGPNVAQGFLESKTVGWSDCGHNNFVEGVVLDPFCGSGTTCLVAAKLNRNWIGIELNSKYCEMARERVAPYANKLTQFMRA